MTNSEALRMFRFLRFYLREMQPARTYLEEDTERLIYDVLARCRSHKQVYELANIVDYGERSDSADRSCLVGLCTFVDSLDNDD